MTEPVLDIDLLDIDLLDDDESFEIDSQAAHLFKHAPYGIDDIFDVWDAQPSSTRRSHPRTG